MVTGEETMATGGVEFDDGIRHIIDEITCTICLEEDRQLCMLPCQHRFCEICLGKIVIVWYVDLNREHIQSAV